MLNTSNFTDQVSYYGPPCIKSASLSFQTQQPASSEQRNIRLSQLSIEWRYDTDSDVDDDVTITLHNTSSESDSQPTLEKELEHSSPRDFKRDAAIQPFSNYPHNIEQG